MPHKKPPRRRVSPRVEVYNPAPVSVPTVPPAPIRIDPSPNPVPPGPDTGYNSNAKPTPTPPITTPTANTIPSNTGNVIINTVTSRPSGPNGSIQYNLANTFAGNLNLMWVNNGLFVGGVPDYLDGLDANGIITARNEFRTGTWGIEYEQGQDNYGRIRMANASTNFYGFNNYTSDAPSTLVITNEEKNWNQAIVLFDAPPYPGGADGTVFGVSALAREPGNVQPSTGNETGWMKLVDVTNSGNVNIGGTLTIKPDFNENTPLANNQVGIRFADGTFQYTAPTAAKITVQDEGSNVSLSNILNFVGANVSVANVAGVATVTVTSSGVQGVQGSTGTSGAQGTRGATGTAGTNGAQGTQGTSGSFAGQGATGSQGASGTNGSQGATGPAGAQGTQGLDGAYAAQGVQGSTGIQGSTGPQGSQGIAGAYAAQGVQGVQGAALGPAGANTEIQFNNNGAFGANSAFTFNYVTGNARVGIVENDGNLDVTGSIQVGNVVGDGYSRIRMDNTNNVFAYQANTAATSGDPGDGHLLWNTNTQIGASSISIDHLTANSIDIETTLATITQNSTITIADSGNVANYQKWQVNGTPTTVSNNYWTYPVALLESGGSAQFSNNQNLTVTTAANFYGFAPSYSPGTLVLTNEEGNTNQAVLLMDAQYGQNYTVFGVSTNANIANGQPSTGYEAGWNKLMDLRGNNFYVTAVSANANPGNILYYNTDSGLITYGIKPTLIQDEGTNVVVSAQTINFTGAGVTATDAGNGVANVNIPSNVDTVYELGFISGTVVPDLNNGTIQTAYLSGNVFFNLYTVTSGRSMTLLLTQATGGNHFVDFNDPVKWASGYKTLSTAVGAIDMINIVNIAGTYYATLTTGYTS